MSQPIVNFRRTKSGTWAVVGPADYLDACLNTGGDVVVTKKDGTTTDFTVRSLGKPFERDGIQQCYGYADPPNSSANPTVVPVGNDHGDPMPEGWEPF